MPRDTLCPQISSAIYNLVGYPPDHVNRVESKRAGGYMANQWTLYWPWSKGNSVPNLLVGPSPSTPTGHKVQIELKANASTPIGGLLEVRPWVHPPNEHE